MLICLSGMILSGQSLKSLRDTDVHSETSYEAPELRTAAINQSGFDTGVTLTDVSGVNLPAGKLSLSVSASCSALMNEMVLSYLAYALE